jgi:hypothetical protein
MAEESDSKDDEKFMDGNNIDEFSNEEEISKRVSTKAKDEKEKKKIISIIFLIGLIIITIIIFAFVFDFFPDLTTGEFDCIYYGTGNNITILNPDYKIDELKIIINGTEYENKNPKVNISGDFHVKIKVLTDELHMNNMFKNTTIKKVNMTSEKSTLIKDMQNSFKECKFLEEFKIEDFDTSEVSNMDHLFENCKKLKNVHMTGIELDDLESVSYTFANTNISRIKLTNFKMSILTNSKNTFDNCNLTIIMKKKENKADAVDKLKKKYNNNINFEFI